MAKGVLVTSYVRITGREIQSLEVRQNKVNTYYNSNRISEYLDHIRTVKKVEGNSRVLRGNKKY